MWQALRAEIGLIFFELSPPPWSLLERAHQELREWSWHRSDNRGWRPKNVRDRHIKKERAKRQSTITHCVICTTDLHQPIGEAVPTFKPRTYCGTFCKRRAIYERRKAERRARRNRKGIAA